MSTARALARITVQINLRAVNGTELEWRMDSDSIGMAAGQSHTKAVLTEAIGELARIGGLEKVTLGTMLEAVRSNFARGSADPK